VASQEEEAAMAEKLATPDIPADIKAMSFETALKALEEIVQQLENGEVDLEKSIEMYERGTKLKEHCETKLKSAQARIEMIVPDSGGKVRVTPAEID
jgi:exodeoxyribonuclease VII small subunit